MNEQTNNRIREDWEKLKMRGYNIPDGEKFGVCDDNTIWDRDDIAEWWLSKIDELLKSQKDSLVEKIKEIRLKKYMINTGNKKGYENLGAIKALDDLLSNLSPNKENE